MLLDANILLYSVDRDSPFHERSLSWMVSALNGPRRVGIPWVSLIAFARIATNPRATRNALTPEEAWAAVTSWLEAPASWIPEPGRGHREILGQLIVEHDVRAGLVTDASLAALCIEHGLEMVSADSDFARFPEIRWINPLT